MKYTTRVCYILITLKVESDHMFRCISFFYQIATIYTYDWKNLGGMIWINRKKPMTYDQYFVRTFKSWPSIQCHVCCCIDFPRKTIFIKTMGCCVFILLYVIWNIIFFLIVNSNLMTWNRVSVTWYNLQLINNNNPHYSFVSKCYNILPWHFTLCHKISYTDTDIKLKN